MQNQTSNSSNSVKTAGNSRRKLSPEVVAYGDGCEAGRRLAEQWLLHPNRGDARHGGTLQGIVLDMVERMGSAADPLARARIRGEVVGFCYAVECPVSSARIAVMTSA